MLIEIVGRIGSLSRLNDRLSHLLLNSYEVEQMAHACADLDVQDIADQCTLVSPSIAEDGVHNFLEGLEETMKDSPSTHRFGSWLNELVKNHREEGASVFASVQSIFLPTCYLRPERS